MALPGKLLITTQVCLIGIGFWLGFTSVKTSKMEIFITDIFKTARKDEHTTAWVFGFLGVI